MRRRPAASAAQADLPLVVVEKIKGAQRIVAVSPEARRAGLATGLTLADARARIPDLWVEEADAFAVKVLPKAGWDPRGLVSFFATLSQEGGPRPPAFLSSHPATEDRIATTSALIRAEKLPETLRKSDGGKLEIIQRRIRLLSGGARAPAPPLHRH